MSSVINLKQTSPVTINPGTFLIDGNSTTKNSFTFSIDINIDSEYKEFDASKDVHLYYNGEELELSLVGGGNKIETSNYTFKVSNLKHSTEYSNFEIFIDKSPQKISIDGKSTKTKRGLIFYYEILLIILISLILILIASLIIWKVRKSRREGSFNREYRSSFY